MRNAIVSFALLATTTGGAVAFNLPNAFDFTNIFKLPSTIANPSIKNAATTTRVASAEEQLLSTIADTGNGKYADVETQRRVLSIVNRLETISPPNPSLLSDVEMARSILDGDWYLQYTAPSEVDDDDDDGAITKTPEGAATIEGTSSSKEEEEDDGESRITTRKFNGAGRVSGGGIPVDASNTVAVQSFDIDESRVTNVISTGIGMVTVGGTYRRSARAPLRAIVAFDTARIALNAGPTLDVSLLFDLRALFKGTKEAGWLETTYVSDRIRIGRGNKGSLFVLTRDRDSC
jgi:hypothetical protein